MSGEGTFRGGPGPDPGPPAGPTAPDDPDPTSGRSRADRRDEAVRLLRELLRMNIEDLDDHRSGSAGGRRPADPDPGLDPELGRLYGELARRNAELRALNEQKNRFLGMAAHDLRNPLGLIQHYSRFLLEDGGDDGDPRRREFLEVIRSSSEFMLGLVDDLLDVTRIEAGRLVLERRTVDLAALALRVAALNRPLAARKRIALVVDEHPGPLAARVDPAKVQQVLTNLLTNAVKFSDPGTTVTVGLERRADRAVVAVRDRGRGIPADELDRLFRPFERTSVRGTAGEAGTGLGLAICRRIVEGHGGGIAVESRVGAGSTFRFWLPLDPPPDAAEAGPGPGAGAGAGPGPPLSVLVADDCPVNRRVTARLLRGLGHRAEAVGDGREALEALAIGRFDALVMDLEMPGLDGLSTAAAIRRAEADRGDGRRLPIVALTAHLGDDERRGALAAALDACLCKPVRPEQLAAILAAVTAGPARPDPR